MFEASQRLNCSSSSHTNRCGTDSRMWGPACAARGWCGGVPLEVHSAPKRRVKRAKRATAAHPHRFSVPSSVPQHAMPRGPDITVCLDAPRHADARLRASAKFTPPHIPLSSRSRHRPPQLTLLLWSLACQSGLRRCRHASSTSAASAMLLCACMSALDHPPALDVCCAAVLVAGLRARDIGRMGAV